MFKIVKSNQIKSIGFIVLLTTMVIPSLLNAQTITGVSILSPVCSGGSGSVSVSFAAGTTYPFDLIWYGSGIESGSTVITGSPQTIPLTSGNYSINNDGTRVYFWLSNYSKYLGVFPAGIHFDQMPSQYSATCASGVTIACNNIAGGTAPYTLILYDKTTKNNITTGSSPLNIPFSTICPNSNRFLGFKVVDANGCSFDTKDSSGIYISCNGLNVQTTSSIASCTNGTAQVTSVSGGVSPYTYSWSNGATSSSISGLVKGQYICTVSDINGCSGQGYSYVNQNPVITVNSTNSPATCNNPDGQATAFPIGGTAPYTYLWDNGSTTKTVNNLLPSNNSYHIAKVTDANGCTGEGYVWINSISPVYVNYSTTPSACTSATGSATLNVSGGTAPYTYIWDGLSFTSNIATGLAIGQYSFKVTDANGCERTGIVEIPPISQITANIYSIDAICPNNVGSILVSASSTAMPINYLWSNGATSASISNLNVGSYSCKITDANSCELTKYAYVGSISPISLGFSSVHATCIFSSNGSATVFPYGGTSPYSYKWNNGATTATVTGLSTGHYWVEVTDANGCKSTYRDNHVYIGYNNANNSCYCTIKGTVYNDLNNNCTKDAGEDGISNVLINGGILGYTTTDDNGNYNFIAPVGSYTITEILDNGTSLSSCQSNGIAVNITSVGGGCTQTVNFSNQLAPKHDVQIFTVDYNAPVPGNTFYQKLIIKNNGNIKETNIQSSYNHDGQLNWQNYSGAPYVSAGTNYFNLSSPLTLKKGESAEYILDYFTPTNIPLGTLIYNRDSVAYTSPLATYWITNEETPWNNISDQFSTVRSSYDPNFKEVFPKGEGSEGNIPLNTKDFRYVVHFENNGTAPAQKVVIIDTLDSDFDVESFRTLESSHGVETRIDNNRVVTFTFNNINLDYTPKGVYNAAAQGYVAFTIKAKNTVVLGTKLENKADIYFDYNAPITTNTTINTYSTNVSSINSIKSEVSNILAYPNPTNSKLNLVLPTTFDGTQKVEIFNLQGQLFNVLNLESENTSFDVSSLSSGLYVVKVTANNGASGFVKFVKQ